MNRPRTHLAFFAKLITFVLIVAALDFVFGRTLRYLYFRQTSGFLFRRTWAIEKTTAPLVIFGDSRAAHGYVPQILERALGLEAYNAGCEGAGIEYHEAVLRAVLKRYTPRRLILDVSPFEFDRARDLGGRLVLLLPYLEGHPEIRASLGRFGRFEKLKLLSQIYPFNSNVLSIILGNLELNKKRRQDLEGYLPSAGVWNEPLARSVQAPGGQLRSGPLESFRSFIRMACERRVPLTVVISPIYQEWARPMRTIEAAAAICRERGISFLDFSQDPEFLRGREYFIDQDHLNHDGAERFSNKLGQCLVAVR